MPKSPKPLMGRDLLEKLEVETKFCKGKGMQVIIPETKFVKATALFIQEDCSDIPTGVEKR